MLGRSVFVDPSRLARLALLAMLACPCAGSDEPPAKAPEHAVDFERHVAPLLSRFGCNAAACHGAFDGKGGLRLSLFGHSPALDYGHLLDRLDTNDPDQSLVLQKPTGQQDHDGGVRFKSDSESYQLIRRWIKDGAIWREGSGSVQRLWIKPRKIVIDDLNRSSPSRSRMITVTAEFLDGSREDVTRLCRFTSRDEGIATVTSDGSVRAARAGDTSIIVSYNNAFAAAIVLVPYPTSVAGVGHNDDQTSHPIDARVQRKLKQLNVLPSGICDDAAFLRRVTLDTIGTIPSAEEVSRFCQSNDADKREKKIDQLLAHPMHAALWATRLCDITKCDVNAMGDVQPLATRRAQMWHDWFRKRIAENTSYAEIVRGVVTATSRESMPVDQWVEREEALIRHRRESFQTDYANRDSLDLYWRRVSADGRYPLKEMAELTAAAFAGIRLNCAQCHKHPFDRWTQNDYAAFANIFSRVAYGSSTQVNVAILAELDRRRAARKEGMHPDPLPRIREVYTSHELSRELPGSREGVRVPACGLDGKRFDETGDLRRQFYDWLIEPGNPYFARSFANRVWAVYFGIGLVDPVDDFSVTNPPSHPQLLQDLARTFRDSGFNLRKLEKLILTSDTYQRSSTPNALNHDDRRNFARQYVRPLIAEVALDVVNKALGTSEDFQDDAPAGALTIEVGTNQVSGNTGRILRALGRGNRESVCDCDRRTDVDLRQFILMMNDQSIHEKIRTGTVRQLLQFDDRQLIRQLYLRFLGRQPGAGELEIGLRHFSASGNREIAFDDLVWALINSREFITNH